MKTSTVAVAVLLSAAATLPFAAEERINSDINSRIREEGISRSQVMRTLHFFTDVYGPRVTGSPSLKAAGEWAVKTMDGWGMKNAHLEPWDWGHPGWTNDLAWGAITAPVKDSLVLEVVAWTPGTKGIVHGKAVNIVIPDQPTPEELTSYFSSVKSQIKGAIILVGPPRFVPVNLTLAPKRRADEDLKAAYDPANPNAGQRGRGQRGGRGQQTPKPGAIPARELGQKINQFLADNGALVRVNDAGREHGQIVAFDNTTYDLTKAVPTVVV
jgi:carboxypeptidase Q